MIRLDVSRLLLAASLAATASLLTAAVSAHAERRPLYDGPAPGSEAWTHPRIKAVRNGNVLVYN